MLNKGLPATPVTRVVRIKARAGDALKANIRDQIVSHLVQYPNQIILKNLNQRINKNQGCLRLLY